MNTVQVRLHIKQHGIVAQLTSPTYFIKVQLCLQNFRSKIVFAEWTNFLVSSQRMLGQVELAKQYYTKLGQLETCILITNWWICRSSCMWLQGKITPEIIFFFYFDNIIYYVNKREYKNKLLFLTKTNMKTWQNEK